MKDPFVISLRELPCRGADFHFTENSGAPDRWLKDLIGDNPCRIYVHVRPSGRAVWTVEGSVQTQMNLVCARCAFGFKYRIDKSFCESLILRNKKTQNPVRSLRFDDNEEAFCTELLQPFFSLKDFLRELIAVEEPLRPLGKSACDTDDDCENLRASLSRREAERKTEQNLPFAELGELLKPPP